MSKILVVVDVQNDFITGALANPTAVEALPSVQKLITKAINDSEPIIWTQDTHTHSNRYLETQEGKNLPIVHCIKNTWGWNIAAEAFYPNYEYGRYLDKGSFGADPIDWMELCHDIERERNERIEQIDICGFVSSICVVSNAMILKALYPGTPIVFHAYASAGLTPEDHEAACKVMECCQIKVIREAE